MYVGYSGFPLRVTAVCDKLTLYADGNNVGASSSPDVLSVTLPGQTDVLAVSCEKTSGPGGFLLSTSMCIVTDNSWLCSDTVTDTAWTEKVFDDTAWQQADQIGQNTAGSSFGEYKEIDPYAHWVWYGTSNTVFCRKTISNTPNKPVAVYVSSMEECARRCLLGTACDMIQLRWVFVMHLVINAFYYLVGIVANSIPMLHSRGGTYLR